MTVYSKICIICQRKFYAVKVNKMYCSKACSNRTRYLPKDLVAALVQRNSKYTLKANKYAAMVSSDGEEPTAVGYEPENISNSNPLGKDQAYLEALAKMEAQKREEQRKKSLLSETGFGEVTELAKNVPVDPEMMEMHLNNKMQEEIIKNVPLKMAENLDKETAMINEVLDFTKKPPQTTSTDTSNTPRKYKIKKFGG